MENWSRRAKAWANLLELTCVGYTDCHPSRSLTFPAAVACAGRFPAALQMCGLCLKTWGRYLPYTWNVAVLGERCKSLDCCGIIMQQSDRQGIISMSCSCGGKQSNLEFALGSKVKICMLKQGVRKSLETVWLVFPMGKTIHQRACSCSRYWALALERQKSALLLLQLSVLWWHSFFI